MRIFINGDTDDKVKFKTVYLRNTTNMKERKK